MGKKKKEIKEEVKEVQAVETRKVESKKKEFDQEAAEKLALDYILPDERRFEVIIKDDKEVKMDKCDVMYVTSDKNVFMKHHEGSARTHARNNGLKVFEVKN